MIFKDYSTLGVRYRDLQARVYEQETRNLTLHEAQPSPVLNFEFLVCKRVKIVSFYPRPPFCRAIKISCTVISRGRALLSCKRNSRGTIGPIRTLVYEN